jgi:hypothetical protein
MNQIHLIALISAGVLLTEASTWAAMPEGRGFATPNAAAQALIIAAKRGDAASLTAILGPSAMEILTTGDPVADRKARNTFVRRVSQRMRLVNNPREPNTRTLVAGTDEWPMPIPIVLVNGKWYFDVEKGKDEILTRRIGSNELDAIEISRGYVEAQQAYAEKDRTGAGRSHYAQRIISSPGKHDGLYWPAGDGSEESPIGDVVARAFAEGYTLNRGAPYHGYHFKVLSGQGPDAPGGERSYLDKDGLMTGGFALVAWPSDYGSTGVMTFLVDKSGIVYEKDLGKDTPDMASSFTEYNPDNTWKPVVNPVYSMSMKK